jgi:hypothetical protein
VANAQDGGTYAVPLALRSARFVPRQSPGKRQPARVTPGAFRAVGLPVPEDRRQQNAYQLSRRQGWEWTPPIDRHLSRRGAELLGGSAFLCVDLDTQIAVDGEVWLDGLRWLTDAGARGGHLLDMSTCVAVRTPGHDGHARGWHLWFRAPREPIRFGALRQCSAVEVKNRCTAPGSPGYEVRTAPPALEVLPAWIAGLAGPPVVPAPRDRDHGGNAWNRLHGLVECVLAAERGERNRVLFWAAARAGELVAAGEIEQATAQKMLRDAAAEIGLLADDGETGVASTITSGLRQAVVR